MTSTLLWTLIVLQIFMGAFDTVYHHELTERLAWRPAQRRELLLHGARNLLYALVFAGLGWFTLHGIWAMALIAILVAELFITLADFVEEDMSRKLPASERVTHTLLALNYGAILVLILPVLIGWAREPSAIVPATHGILSLVLAVSAIGVVISGTRDFAAAARIAKLTAPSAAELVRDLGGRRTVLVTGATGFIGKRLVEALAAAGHQTIVLTRSKANALELRPPFQLVTDLDQIASDARIDAIVNLAGEPIGNALWTKAKRHKILNSRLEMTADVVRLIARLEQRPAVLVNGSAIGWYGLRGDEVLTEAGGGRACFSREICTAWEAEAEKAQPLGIRTVLLRIGLVLGTEGGVLSRLLFPFEYGLGGRIGSGRQWMSWIARDDLVRLIAHVIAKPELSGPVNATAPEPARNSEFSTELGRAMHRPAFMPLPALPLHWLAGAFADELLLGGQRVVPQKALASGFVFRYPTLRVALAAIVGKGESARQHRRVPFTDAPKPV